MQVWLWAVFFLVANALGVQVFKAALTLPVDEALLPRLLTVPLVALAAVSAVRIMNSWSARDR